MARLRTYATRRRRRHSRNGWEMPVLALCGTMAKTWTKSYFEKVRHGRWVRHTPKGLEREIFA